MNCFGLFDRPSREFAPAGDLLSGRPESRQRVAPVPAPLAARGVPCVPCRLHLAWRSSGVAQHAGAVLGPVSLRRTARPAQNSLRCAPVRQLRGVSSRSALRARLAVLRFSAPPKGSDGTAEQPKAKPRRRLASAVGYAPFSTAEERKALKPCAQRTSRTDSAQLLEQSVAARVLRGASRPEYRRAPAAWLRSVRSGGTLCLLSGRPESRSPAGAKSRHGPCRNITISRVRGATP